MTTKLTAKYQKWVDDEKEKAEDQNQGFVSIMESIYKAQGLKFNSLIAINFLLTRWWCNLNHSSTTLNELITERLLRNVKVGKLKLEVMDCDLTGSQPPDVQAVSLPWVDHEGTWFDLKVGYCYPEVKLWWL